MLDYFQMAWRKRSKYYNWNTGCWSCHKSPYCNGYWKGSGEVEHLDIVKEKWRDVGTNESLGAPSKQFLLEEKDKLSCLNWCPKLLLAATTASFEPLAHCRNVGSSNLFYRCTSELAQLVPLPYSLGRSTRYYDGLHDFSVTIPRCYTDVYVNSFFLRTARLWKSLARECFPLTYDLNGFKSRISRHLLSVGSF